jgi:myo-inositol-1(or 4)-monophosphatase
MRELDEYLALACHIARSTGQSLLQKHDKWSSLLSNSDRQVKLVADIRSEELILGALRLETDFLILSEESVSSFILPSEKDCMYWVIDPLDGSLNYHRGIPLCCISIALCRNEEVLMGCIFDFNSDEMFTGVLGGKSKLNDTLINVSTVNHRSLGVLFSGLPAGSDYSSQRCEKLARSILQWNKVRMIGSAALSLAYVSAGRGDAYQEDGIFLWDVAAGLAVVQGAGGAIRHSNFDHEFRATVTASNNLLFPP